MSMDGGENEPADQGQGVDQRVRSFAMLLGPADLPGPGWEIVEERHWPTGQLDPNSDKSRRALRAGGITAWRSLARTGATRSAWVEVVPYATADDAALSLGQVPRFFVGTQQPDEVVMSEQSIDDHHPAGVVDTWVYEKSTTGPAGSTLSRYVGGTVDQILFLTCLSGREAFWPWPDVVDVAERQAEQVRTALETAEGFEIGQK